MLQDIVRDLSKLEGLTFTDIDAAQDFLDAMRYSATQEWLDPARISYGRVDSTDVRALQYADAAEPVILLPHTFDRDSFGRDAVSESNFRALAGDIESREENGEPEPLVKVSYWNTTGIAVRLTLLTEDVADGLAGLTDYPVLDDDLLSEVEQEIVDESWESYGRDDLKAELADALGLESSLELPESLDDDELDLAWLDVMNDQNIYPEVENGGAYWRGMADRGTMLALMDRLGLDPDAAASGYTTRELDEWAREIVGDPAIMFDGDLLSA